MVSQNTKLLFLICALTMTVTLCFALHSVQKKWLWTQYFVLPPHSVQWPLYWHSPFYNTIKIPLLFYLHILPWRKQLLVMPLPIFLKVMLLKAFQQPDSKADISKGKGFIPDLPSYISTQSHRESNPQRGSAANLSTSSSLNRQKCIEATGWMFVNFTSVDPTPSLKPSL